LLIALGWRFVGDADDGRPEKVLQRHEEVGIKAADKANSETKGILTTDTGHSLWLPLIG